MGLDPASAGGDALNRDAVLATLDAARPALAVIAGPWWVIGSAAMALHGFDAVVVGDIDILLDPADARRLCADHGFVAIDGGDDGLFHSDVYARRTGLPLTIEIMAGFSVRERRVRVGRAVLRDGWPVASVADLIAMCRLFDRPKDQARLALIGL